MRQGRRRLNNNAEFELWVKDALDAEDWPAESQKEMMADNQPTSFPCVVVWHTSGRRGHIVRLFFEFVYREDLA